ASPLVSSIRLPSIGLTVTSASARPGWLTKGEALVFDGVSGALLQPPAASRASHLTQRVMAGLHFAQFGGYPMRWPH
ncbi:hypothetical protein, partial [Escherichia coli]|uniref:hypothetical protein n=1 Tax=Escherichia coli TaxID=562 RepID=UPI00215A3C56